MSPSPFLEAARGYRQVALGVVAFFSFGLVFIQAALAEDRVPAMISVHVDGGILSLDAHDAPLGDVLEAGCGSGRHPFGRQERSRCAGHLVLL